MPLIATVTLNPAIDRLLEVERLSADDSNRVLLERHYPAGKGIDASRVIHELGGKTVAYCLVGGAGGAEIVARLQQEGVPVETVEVPGETRSNVLLFERATGKQYLINASGPVVAPEKFEEILLRMERRRGGFAACIAAGSLPVGLPKSAYADLVRRLADVRCFVDTDGEALALAVAACPWAIKPNRHEAGRLLGLTISDEAGALTAIRRLAALGIEHTLLSLGKDGALLAHGGSIWRGRAPVVPVRSAVGAGDSMVAAYTLRIVEGLAPGESLRWALAAGAATALTPGTELCHRADVERLVVETRIERIA